MFFTVIAKKNNMKKRLGLWSLLCVLFVMTLQMTAVAAEKATISSCIISGKDEVKVTVQIPSIVESDDANYYLFELKPYQNDIGNRTDYCGVTIKNAVVTFSARLHYKQADSRLYSKFVAAIFKDGQYVAISDMAYITNPEAIADYTVANPKTTSIKGITADNAAILDLEELGVQHASYEMGVNRFFAPSVSGYVNYNFGGKTYQFNKDIVSQFDMVMSVFESQKVEVTMNLVNYYADETLFTIKPNARKAGYTHYAYNTDEQYGVESLEALIAFLAERYSGHGHGLISNWIIGNEVNNNNPWYYSGDYQVDDYVTEYEKAYRMFYNGIKAVNANARVLTCIDQRWTWEDGTANQYGAKRFLDIFHARIRSHGDIDWGIAWHPHPVPLYAPKFWDMPAGYKSLNLVTHATNTKMISPMNMEVFTNYMTQPTMLNNKGQVRYIIVSEILFNSSSATVEASEELQAAAFAYAYKLADKNPYIKAFIVHRIVDSPQEQASDGISCGLYHCDANGMPTDKKKIYDVYKYIDTEQSDAYTKFALPIIGAGSWGQIIK